MQEQHARGLLCLCWQVLQVLMTPCQYVSEVDVEDCKQKNRQASNRHFRKQGTAHDMDDGSSSSSWPAGATALITSAAQTACYCLFMRFSAFISVS